MKIDFSRILNKKKISEEVEKYDQKKRLGARHWAAILIVGLECIGVVSIALRGFPSEGVAALPVSILVFFLSIKVAKGSVRSMRWLLWILILLSLADILSLIFSPLWMAVFPRALYAYARIYYLMLAYVVEVKKRQKRVLSKKLAE